MHELSLCEDLLSQVSILARQHQAHSVHSITVNIGALSGVEPMLLESAFAIGRVGTIAEQARLILEPVPARVRCGRCGIDAEVPANRLICPSCRSTDTSLLSGDELILARVELDCEPEHAATTAR